MPEYMTTQEYEAWYAEKMRPQDEENEIRWLNGVDRHAVEIRELKAEVEKLRTIIQRAMTAIQDLDIEAGWVLSILEESGEGS